MSQVRAKMRIPLCTTMCVVRFEEFAPAVGLGAVDVIHGDVCKWGGIAATKALAAHLAVVASTPVLSRAIDSMHYLHADDIVAPLRLSGGRPAGAGRAGARRGSGRGEAGFLRGEERAGGRSRRMTVPRSEKDRGTSLAQRRALTVMVSVSGSPAWTAPLKSGPGETSS
ncbi:hypothetical protein A4R44_05776 [Amycolatopsis sp. M39]|nr:hypothetical protein A4R44_05776 [Amycolatopsis sp. M39]